MQATQNNLTDKIELVDDAILKNEEFKKNVAVPYFKDIYKDLVSQSDDKNKGINRLLSYINSNFPPVSLLIHKATTRANDIIPVYRKLFPDFFKFTIVLSEKYLFVNKNLAIFLKKYRPLKNII